MSTTPITCETPAALRTHLSQGYRHFVKLAFAEGDLSNLDLSGCRFKDADLRACELSELSLQQAKLFEGAIISHEQAAQIMTAFGFVVA
ncbi:pentapeptide repeat-containing protein [Robbsia sp. KACC 23696]|uniref:pentapeptide repeat-containing protein n=1 Tax=Robbsia sp. KACC 23696 TaxID=3149231 RepID=UPI00325A4D33